LYRVPQRPALTLSKAGGGRACARLPPRERLFSVCSVLPARLVVFLLGGS